MTKKTWRSDWPKFVASCLVPWHLGNYREWTHSEMSTWCDKNIRSNAPYKEVLTTQISHLASWAKWLSVRLRTRWLWFESRYSHLTFIYRACLEQGFLDIQVTEECGFTVKHVRDMIRTYSQSQLISIREVNVHSESKVCFKILNYEKENHDFPFSNHFEKSFVRIIYISPCSSVVAS